MTYDHNNAFARILRGEAPCIKVDETDAVLAFMDLMPQSDGHVLVIPKETATDIFELSDTAAEACMCMVRRVALAVQRGTAARWRRDRAVEWARGRPDRRPRAFSCDSQMGRPAASTACRRHGRASHARIIRRAYSHSSEPPVE